MIGQFPYYLIFLIVVFITISEHLKTKFFVKNEKSLKYIVLLIILLFMSFKFSVGGDWGNYLNEYDVRFKDLNLRDFSSDIGWLLLNISLSSLGLSFVFLNALTAIIFLFGIHCHAKMYSNYWLYFLILTPYFIFIVGMGYTRQSVSIGLALIAISILLKENTIKSNLTYLFLIFIGVLFHKSVGILIFLPIFNSRLTYLRVNVITCLLFILSIFVIFFIFDRGIVNKFNYFFEVSYSSFGAYLRIIFLGSIAFFYLLTISKFKIDRSLNKINKIISFYCLTLFLLLFIIPTSVVIDRLSLYFYIIISSSVLLIYEFSKNQFNKDIIIYSSVFISSFLLFTWLNFADNAISWVPYRLYFFNLDKL